MSSVSAIQTYLDIQSHYILTPIELGNNPLPDQLVRHEFCHDQVVISLPDLLDDPFLLAQVPPAQREYLDETGHLCYLERRDRGGILSAIKYSP